MDRVPPGPFTSNPITSLVGWYTITPSPSHDHRPFPGSRTPSVISGAASIPTQRAYCIPFQATKRSSPPLPTPLPSPFAYSQPAISVTCMPKGFGFQRPNYLVTSLLLSHKLNFCVLLPTPSKIATFDKSSRNR